MMLPLLLATAVQAPGSGPTVYSVPAGMRHNDDYTVRVRRPGGAWIDLFEHDVVVDLDDPQHASLVRFDMDGPVEVEVQKNNGDPRRVEVRPARAGVEATLKGNAAFLKLERPAKLSVEFDSDRRHNLHLFATPKRVASAEPPTGVQTVRFGPGIHVPPDLPGSSFSFPSHTRVVLDPDAVLRGKIVLDRVTDVSITGRGIIETPERGFEITYSSGIVIDGPTVINPKHYTVYCGQSDHVTLSDLNTFSAAPWSDGLDFMSCSDVSISNVFLRTSDDSIAIYGHRWGFRGDARRFDVRDAVLWADVAHPINIGLHGGGDASPEAIENLTFRRLDVLEHDEDDPEYQGVIAISDGDTNLVRHVRFDDVAVEHVEEGSLLNLRVVFNAKYSLSPGRGISDVVIRNIRVTADRLRPSIIAGLDPARRVEGVAIEGLTIGGRAVTSLRDAGIVVGEHAGDVSLRR